MAKRARQIDVTVAELPGREHDILPEPAVTEALAPPMKEEDGSGEP